MIDHNRNLISVAWPAASNTQGTVGVITGYKLLMDNGFNENFELVFDGSGLPDVRSFTATGLTVGRPYRF